MGADCVGVFRRHHRDRGGLATHRRYSETWISYRTASERMKRERRLYSHGAGSYRGLPEREAYLTFVEAIEGIIAEEQNIFWRDRGNNLPTHPGNADADARYINAKSTHRAPSNGKMSADRGVGTPAGVE